jgi:hypothetical protein
MKLTCAFATGPDTPDHVAVAESLGYERAWLYDSPALYPDVWMQLALAATRTSTIGLGPGVLVEAAGMTEIAYQPAGPDIPGELRTFADALRGSAG